MENLRLVGGGDDEYLPSLDAVVVPPLLLLALMLFMQFSPTPPDGEDDARKNCCSSTITFSRIHCVSSPFSSDIVEGAVEVPLSLLVVLRPNNDPSRFVESDSIYRAGAKDVTIKYAYSVPINKNRDI